MRYETWSGETWYLHSGHAAPAQTISSIEQPASKPAKASSKGKKKAEVVAFGFGRALAGKPKKKRKK